MILPKGGGEQGYFGGPLDVLLIQHDVTTGRYHAAVYEEKPLPGPRVPVEQLELVRLKSKMHHTGGADTLEGAQEHLRELAEQIELPEGNVWADEPCDVTTAGPDVMLQPNWTRQSVG